MTSGRVKEIDRVARVHRDPFEAIMLMLEAERPVREYRKITDEILKRIPDERRYPRAAAEAVRSFLLLRLGLHLGLRQKNLRQLLFCPRGQVPRTERHLEDSKRGEMRWSERDKGWEVFIPAVAFKNANSSYFGSKPFRLVLPNLRELHDHLEAYITRHRRVLLAGAADTGTFFVKTVKATSTDAAYNQDTFYEAWRLTIQRYGVYNPYTGRGAIKDFCLTDHTTSAMCSPHISSSKRVRTNKPVTRFRTPPTWLETITVAFCHRTKQH